MALLFMDSFDHYAIGDIGEKYTSTGNSGASIQATGGRRSSACWRKTVTSSLDYLTKSLSASGSTILAGVAIKLSASPAFATTLLAWKAGSTQQMTVTVKTDNKLEVFRGDHGGTSLGTTSSGLTPGAFGYVEVKIVLHASAGTVLVKIDGATVLNLTSQNTANSGTAWDSFTTLGSAAGFSVNIDYDDLYLADGSGAAPWNDLLGDVRVDARVPTGAGATTGWTPSTGSNYANVDDATPDDDATYNSAATSPLTDTFVVQDAPVAGATIYGVQQCLSMKKSDSGTCTVALVVRHSGTDYVGSDLSPGMSYTYGLAITQTNPGTSAQWTESDFNAAEFGYRRTG